MAKHMHKFWKSVFQKYNKRRYMIPILLLIAVTGVCLIAGLSGNLLAKYYQTDSREALAKAEEFYFSSDYLTVEGLEYTLSPGTDGTVDVTFKLRNYDGLNQSELDINYTVAVEPAVTVKYENNDETEHSITVDDANGEEAVTLTGLQAGNTYVVTVVGENGYQKTLKATFKVEEIAGLFKNTQNYADYVLLTIWSEGESGTVKFIVPSGLIPDATDDALKKKVGGNEIEVTLQPYESRTFRFFTMVEYSSGPIEVQEVVQDLWKDLQETALN